MSMMRREEASRVKLHEVVSYAPCVSTRPRWLHADCALIANVGDAQIGGFKKVIVRRCTGCSLRGYEMALTVWCLRDVGDAWRGGFGNEVA